MGMLARTCAALALAFTVSACVNAVMMGGMGAGMLVIAGQEIKRANHACKTATAEMRAHLGRLDRAGGDSLPTLIPAHRERVEALVSRCIEGSTDTTWRPLGRELRQDAGRLSQLPPEDLPPFMAEHRARLERYLASRDGKARATQRGAP